MSSHDSIFPNELGTDSLRRLLIVDDDRDFVEKLVAILRTGGYDVATASNSRGAHDAVATFEAQLAVIDLHLGDETGIELMSSLKERRPDLLFLALAEDADFGVAVATMRAGFDDILAKPVIPIELSAALEGASSKLALIHQRRAAEVALREGETRFAAVCESSPAPIIITRLCDDSVVFANDACARLLGVPKEELTGFHAPDMWHDPDDRKAVVDQIRRDGSVRNIEARMKSADGSVRWVLGSAELRTIDGEAVVIVGLNDITERKRAEHEAAQAHARLIDSIECIPDGFALYGADDRLVWCNERYREVYPKHADVIVPGSTFEDMLRDGVARGEFSAAVGREEEWIAERLRSHADPPGPIEQELTDGRWLRVEERRTREGGIVGLRTDITAIKRAERSAADAKARLNDAVESIAEGFVLYDSDERFVLCNEKYRELNPSFQDILIPGVRLEDVIRASAASEGAPLEIDDIDSWTRMRLEEYRAGTGSREILHADGRWILASERRMRNGGMVGIRIDITEIKQHQRELAESEARFRAIVEDQTEFIVRSLPHVHTLTFVNEAYARHFDKTPDKLIGTSLMDHVPEAERAEVDARLATLGPDSPVVHVEHSAITVNGEVRWHQWTSRAIFDDAGNIKEIQAVGRDTTERRRVEVALHESEEWLSSFLNNIPSAIYLKDTEGRYVLVNESVMKQYGLPINRLIGKTVYDLHPKDESDATVKQDREVLKQGIPIEAERELTFPDGSKHNIIAVKFPVRNESGEFVGVGGINIDITDRKRAENILRENEQRLRDYAEASADWFWEMDSDLRFTYMSPNVERILGVAPEWHYGKTREDLLGDVHDSDAWNEHLKALREHRPFRNFEYFRVGNGVDPKWLRTSGVPVFAEDGAFLGYRGTGSDITERKQAEERLRQAQKMEAVGQLTGGIAHDFNNLLAIILGNAEMLKEGLGDDRVLAENVIVAANRGGELTHQLLAFSRRQPLLPRLTNFDELIAGMTDMLRRTLGEMIEIETRSTPKLWQTEVDLGQSENAVLNLAINARDAMADGGVLLIETANINIADPLDGEAAGVEPGDYVMLAVTDSGVGVAPDVLEHVFEPFFTTKEVGQGSGLGLSMVYGFANQSGGFVSIDSELGRGTTVKLFLPRARKSDQWAERQLAEEEPQGRGETVLLVEDETGVRALTAKLLGKLGYAVIEASDGDSAVATLESTSRVDLLLTDVVLPGAMSGPKIAEEVCRRRTGIKVLYMSGYPDQVLRSHGPLVEGAEVLSKPFRRNQLAQKVRRALDGNMIADPQTPTQDEPLPMAGSSRDPVPPT